MFLSCDLVLYGGIIFGLKVACLSHHAFVLVSVSFRRLQATTFAGNRGLWCSTVLLEEPAQAPVNIIGLTIPSGNLYITPCFNLRSGLLKVCVPLALLLLINNFGLIHALRYIYMTLFDYYCLKSLITLKILGPSLAPTLHQTILKTSVSAAAMVDVRLVSIVKKYIYNKIILI